MYVGYLLFQFPSNVILSKFPRPGIYLSVAAVLWGGVSASMAAANSYSSVMVIRFFLGFVEAPFFVSLRVEGILSLSDIKLARCTIDAHIMVCSFRTAIEVSYTYHQAITPKLT